MKQPPTTIEPSPYLSLSVIICHYLDSVTLELVRLVEESTAVRSVIVFQVETGGVRLGDKLTLVAQTAQYPLKQSVMVHLLQTDYVWAKSHDLLHKGISIGKVDSNLKK